MNTNNNENPVNGLNSSLTHTPDAGSTAEAGKSILGKMKNWGISKYLGITLLMTTPVMMTNCTEKTEIAAETPAQLAERLHAEAEAYADKQGWSQGVKSLVAGVIDYYYYYPNQAAADAKQPLIRLSYQVDVADFIAKIEADAAARGTYDPKTEGVLQATLASLEGDNKNTAWFIPSNVVYDSKAQGKSKLSLNIGDYPAPVANFTTIGKDEGISPNKEMQIYSGYGIKNATKPEDRVKDQEKRGALKEIL